jgi:hypothetical protein
LTRKRKIPDLRASRMVSSPGAGSGPA